MLFGITNNMLSSFLVQNKKGKGDSINFRFYIVDPMMTSRKISLIAVAVLCLVFPANAQENAQLRVPRSLEECYRNQDLLERDNQLPMTIKTLIDLIRKIENTPGLNQDMRQISVSMLHRFRQDGIIRAPGVAASPSVLPYSPADFQFTKHKILLSRLIPGNALQFPNSTLTARERCTLHFMLSTSIDRRIRGDEGQRCKQLAHFRAMRVPRKADRTAAGKSNFLGDVEFLETIHAKVQTKASGKISQYDHNGEMYPDEESTQASSDYDVEHPFGSEIGLVDIANEAVSQCPVESGIIWTPWGAVNVGNLLAGIAAGLQPQRIKLGTLLALARRTGGSSPQQTDIIVDNKWAATLAGDLAEAALIQAPSSQISVGASGAWNSTTEPRWYFLTQRERLEMTDAEIRGGLDGLIIASKIEEWKSKAPDMKLSQLLTMYYSQRGVLDSGIRACDRRLSFTTYAPVEQIKAQTIAFANVLDREMRLRVTLFPEAIKTSAIQAVDALSIYIPQSLNDLSCEATAPTPNDPTDWKTATDLYVYIDTTWHYRDIGPILSGIWPNIDIGLYESRVTLLNAMDCKIIVNTTNSLTNVSYWNATSHKTYPAGLNLPNVFKSIENLTMSLMNAERAESSSGGRSLIALIVVQNGGVSGPDENYASQKIQYLREQVPDLRILFMASGAVNRFASYVKEKTKDLFTIRIGDNDGGSQASPVVNRIRETPRRIINHRCGSNWQTQGYGQSSMNQYVSPGSVNYYRLHPNFFFQEGSGRRVRVQGKGGSAVTVCSSREVELPRGNASKAGDLKCRQVISSESFEVDLNSPCSGHSVIHTCPPLYISVEANQQSAVPQFRCNDIECVSPDQIPYVIQTDNLGCFSGVTRTLGSLAIVTTLLYILSILY